MDQRVDMVERPEHFRPRRSPGTYIFFARYSRFVGLMKVMLPAIAAGLLGLLVAWPKFASHEEKLPIGFSHSDMAKVDTLSVRNPHYYGTDDKNLPFSVTADVATQTDPQNLVVTLEKPVADLTRSDGTGVVVNAQIGFFRQKDDTLDLMGSVNLYQDDGYEMHTESARVLIGPGNASGDEAVQGQGPAGTITGEGFRLYQRGRTIVFTGHSKAVLTMSSHKDGS